MLPKNNERTRRFRSGVNVPEANKFLSLIYITQVIDVAVIKKEQPLANLLSILEKTVKDHRFQRNFSK